ncbi:JAB domain-containing protein [Ectopseudomonas hydrolytica]|uniref:JAB domain-containing protein n=1 Tax=Ectopseudomonas hydrolytica TaxID=2493633 RepID=UPI003EDF9394
MRYLHCYCWTANTVSFDSRSCFAGTLDSASVYPREVVKVALEHNAAAMVLVHNHPSGDPEPSHADRVLTSRLKQALEMVGVRTLDHIIVGAEGCVSLAELNQI